MSIESLVSLSDTSSASVVSWQEETADAPPSEQELIESHLHLVRSAVARIKRAVPAHIDGDDLYSVGLAGLVSAVRKFNPIQGRTFAGFAALRIRGAMLDELRRLDTCSRRARARARQIRTTTAALEQKFGRVATEEEVRVALGLNRADFAKWVNEAQPIGFVAIDRGADGADGAGSALHELIADESVEVGSAPIEKAELVALLARHMGELPALQKQILSQYYFENIRIGEIARSFGVTSSRISQVHTRALDGLRACLTVERDR